MLGLDHLNLQGRRLSLSSWHREGILISLNRFMVDGQTAHWAKNELHWRFYLCLFNMMRRGGRVHLDRWLWHNFWSVWYWVLLLLISFLNFLLLEWHLRSQRSVVRSLAHWGTSFVGFHRCNYLCHRLNLRWGLPNWPDGCRDSWRIAWNGVHLGSDNGTCCLTWWNVSNTEFPRFFACDNGLAP